MKKYYPIFVACGLLVPLLTGLFLMTKLSPANREAALSANVSQLVAPAQTKALSSGALSLPVLRTDTWHATIFEVCLTLPQRLGYYLLEEQWQSKEQSWI